MQDSIELPSDDGGDSGQYQNDNNNNNDYDYERHLQHHQNYYRYAQQPQQETSKLQHPQNSILNLKGKGHYDDHTLLQQLQQQSVISPKGRRLSRMNINGNSQESLAYSNSTYNKWTERQLDNHQDALMSPGTFYNTDQTDQNLNTLNFLKSSSGKKQRMGTTLLGIGMGVGSGLGSGSASVSGSTTKDRGAMMIEFSKISEEDDSRADMTGNNISVNRSIKGRKQQEELASNEAAQYREHLEMPNFRSQSPSPLKSQTSQSINNDSLIYISNSHNNNFQEKTPSSTVNNPNPNSNPKRTISKPKYVKINPSNRSQPGIGDVIFNKNKSQSNHQSSQAIAASGSLKTDRSTKSTTSKKSLSNSSKNKKCREKSPSRSPYSPSTKGSHNSRNPNNVSSSRQQIELHQSSDPLRQRIKELEYALNVESIATEQLRTKVNILNELLEQKFLQKNGIDLKLLSSMCNRNNNNSNVNGGEGNNKSKSNQSGSIDLYVEMKILERKNHELAMENSRLQDQNQENWTKIDELVKEVDRLGINGGSTGRRNRDSANTQTSYLCQNQSHSQALPLNQSAFEEQKETLLQFIDTQEAMIKAKDEKIQKLQANLEQTESQLEQVREHLSLMDDKQKRFADIERPKLMSQINELNSMRSQLAQVKESKQRLQMQNNLIKMRLQATGSLNISSSKLGTFNSAESSANCSPKKPQNDSKSGHKQKQTLLLSTSARKRRQILEQNASKDLLSLTLLQEEQLSLLKKQRDYFREELEKCKAVASENYQLKLENARTVQELNELKKLAEFQCNQQQQEDDGSDDDNDQDI